MKKYISITLLFLVVLVQAMGQTKNKLSLYLNTQYNKTIYDITLGNNPWAIGTGLQGFLHNKSKFTPTIDVTADAYLYDDKVLRLYPNGKPIPDAGGMVNVFAGAAFFPSKTVFLSFTAGPSFISGNTLFGIKPSFGFYFSDSRRWMVKASYINVFNRDKITKEDFGTISFSIGLKLF